MIPLPALIPVVTIDSAVIVGCFYIMYRMLTDEYDGPFRRAAMPLPVKSDLDYARWKRDAALRHLDDAKILTVERPDLCASNEIEYYEARLDFWQRIVRLLEKP